MNYANVSLNNIYTNNYEVNLNSRPAKVSAYENNLTGKRDEVNVSNQAQDFQTAMKMARGTEDIRTEKVDALRNAVKTGAYVPDMNAVANKILGL